MLKFHLQLLGSGFVWGLWASVLTLGILGAIYLESGDVTFRQGAPIGFAIGLLTAMLVWIRDKRTGGGVPWGELYRRTRAIGLAIGLVLVTVPVAIYTTVFVEVFGQSLAVCIVGYLLPSVLAWMWRHKPVGFGPRIDDRALRGRH